MRLDEGFADQKLSLDITPLIDIIFLLVLFFAVSTSFISGEDLAKLQTDVVTLGDDRIRLTAALDAVIQRAEHSAKSSAFLIAALGPEGVAAHLARPGELR